MGHTTLCKYTQYSLNRILSIIKLTKSHITFFDSGHWLALLIYQKILRVWVLDSLPETRRMPCAALFAVSFSSGLRQTAVCREPSSLLTANRIHTVSFVFAMSYYFSSRQTSCLPCAIIMHTANSFPKMFQILSKIFSLLEHILKDYIFKFDTVLTHFGIYFIFVFILVIFLIQRV